MEVKDIISKLVTCQLPEPSVRRLAREMAGATQEWVAEELEVSRAAISRYESGKRRPRGEIAVRYAELLRSLIAFHGSQS